MIFIFAFLRQDLWRPRRLDDIPLRQGELQHVAAGQQDRPFDDVFQFAHVARPLHARQGAQGFRRDAVDIASHAAGDFEGKRLHQQRDVVGTLAQRRQVDREHVEPVVEIAAEFPVDNHLLEIAVGGGDQSNVGLNQLVAPQTFELLLLEDAQQFGLQFQRHIAHFIEEQGAFVRQFEAADTLGAGPGERAAFVAEQIALQQPGGHRGAVHLHHPPTVSSAEVMNGAGDKLFAGAGFAEDQHGAVALRHHLDLLEHIVHRLAAADNLPEFALDIIELLGEGEVLIHQPLFQALNFAVGEGVIDSDRHPLGDLPQQLEIGGGEDLFVALRQLKHPEQGIAGHQRQQAQGLDLIAPHLEEHFLIRRESVMFVQIKQQHLFAFEHALGEGAGFIHLALVVNRVAGVKIMRGIDVELPLAVAAQHHADGVDPEVAMDLFRHLADQLVDIQA